MYKKITNETINTIKDGAVVELGANAEIKIKGKSVVLTIDGEDTIYLERDYTESQLVKFINMKIDSSNHKKLYNIINAIFTGMDYNRTFEFGGFTLGLGETEDDNVWWDKGICVMPTDAKEEDENCLVNYYTIGSYFLTYADLLRGDRDIIGDMANDILRDMETVAPYLPTGGTTVTHKTVVE